MSGQYSKFPIGVGQTQTYSTLTAFPAAAPAGALAVALDTATLYEYDQPTLSWLALGVPGSAISIATANGLSLALQAISLRLADTTHNGALSSTDWNTFNGKQDALTIGDLTDVGTDGITITGGTGSIIGSGVSIDQHVADSTHNGYLSSSDWVRFDAATSAIHVFNSAASAGGGASEAVAVVGILSTDTVMSVSQSVPGANSLPLIGFNTLINDGITLQWSADPGAGAIAVVTVLR